jgi:hypothetical protein
MLKFYSNWSSSNVGMRNADLDSSSLRDAFQVKGRNIYNTLSYRDRLNENWKIDASIAYNYQDLANSNQLVNTDAAPVYPAGPAYQQKNYRQRAYENFAQARAVLSHYLPGNATLRFGAEHFYTQQYGYSRDTLLHTTEHLTAAFAESDIYLSGTLAAKVGVRAEHSSLLDKWWVAPRISMAWKTSAASQFNLAYGLFYQDLSEAAHYILNYTYKANNRMFRAEAYYKAYRHLLQTIPEYGYNGNGYAKGVELFFRDKRSIKNLDYWVTYTYLDAKRHYLNYPYELQPEYTTPHTATVAIKQQLPAINTFINLSWAFATGRPYYNFRYSADGKQSWINDEGTTKNYSTVNLHVAWLTSFFPKWKWKDFSGFAAGVNNLLGSKQVFGYRYNYNGSVKQAITPPATRNYYVGIFMSFGKDRTSDILDNL